MKHVTFICISLLLILACTPGKKINNIDNVESNYEKNHLEGTWILEWVDFYAALNDSENETTKKEKISWRFFKDQDSDRLRIESGGKTSEFRYASDDCVIEFNNEIYLYELHLVENEKGEVVGKSLSVTKSYEISIPDASRTMHFRNVELIKATESISKNEGTPTFRSKSLYTEMPDIKGKWSLSHVSLNAPDLYQPSYQNEDVTWEFIDGKSWTEVVISKRNTPIKNDVTPSEGNYNYWTNQCLILINNHTYRYEFEYDEKGEVSLRLLQEASLMTSDITVYIFERADY